MANLAQQLKAELTARAKDNDICKTRLLDWVMNRFREGDNPVVIKCSSFIDRWKYSREIIGDCGPHPTVELKDNGRYYVCGRDVTDTEISCAYAPNGKDESDKRLYLESEGFRVFKTWKYGVGDILEIRY